MVFSTNPDFAYEEEADEEPATLAPEKQNLLVSIDRKGRGGKQVTLVTGFVGTSDDLAECDEDDLAAEVERLVSRLADASDGFDRRMKQYEEASAARQSAYAESFGKSFRNYEEALEKRHKAYAESFEKLLKDCEESSIRRQNACEKAFDGRLKAFEEAFAARHKAYADAFEKRLAEYGAEFEARRKEYVEFFRRRIDELEKSANAEKSRADAANAKLAAVTNALR